ncbi:Protein phosphatase 2C [Andreprevotia lacus DSM 23236]|jgi:hypothetical protein|uniref:Protein phosphatase 2C n=1 Tax=Andreprevotia lacus DSM 23236 TaxID=1121001 RepID=A0A1W1XWW1_9NEIS|nr:PP2C family serine/threonine-protein phosphatase [Andreprevotia lacus]SMC28357.1 Protein phosphatase 2C [Andreprevotia lacus DSM 23236]
MTTENTRQTTVPPQLQAHAEELVLGLFKESQTPFFDRGKVAGPLIDEFAKDGEVQRLAYEFASKLKKIWAARYPGKPGLFPKARLNSTPQIKPMAFAQLDAPSATPGNSEVAPAMVAPPPIAEAATQMPDQAAKTEDTAPPARPVPHPAPATMHDASTPSQVLRPGQVPIAPVVTATIPEGQPVFHLPNCKAGSPYSARMEGLDKTGRQIRVAHVKFPDGFGLTFDPATQMVSGHPLLDGEFDLDLQWSYAEALNEGKTSGTCQLIVNPDPRSLWKVLEPAGDLPYRKAHLDQKLLRGTSFNIAAASRRGRSHEHGGSFRDDDFFIADDTTSGWSVLIVADGAGSAKSSREGSRIAVQTAGVQLTESLAGVFGQTISNHLASWDTDPASQNAIGTEFHYFFHKMAHTTVQAIEQEAQVQNAQARDYATTLLVAAVKKEGPSTFLATFWMGDGAIAAYGPKGTVKLMGTPDGGEFAGQTRFLDRNALADQGFGKRVRVGRLPNISAIILMTDGVSDPYFETDNGLADETKWDALWNEIQPHLEQETSSALNLLEWLHFFKQGHHDDRTIALLW